MSIPGGSLKPHVEVGMFEASVGGEQPGFKGLADPSTSGCLTGRVEVTAR